MSQYQPPFAMNDHIVNLTAEIAELCGEITMVEGFEKDVKLRRDNRIRTIHSSLAIEQNTLTLEQVTAVIDGKRVLAPSKDIKEVQNAFSIYEKLDSLDPFSPDDLLSAHGAMMRGLIDEAGRFRSGNVGVYAGEELIHMGTPAKYVPQVMEDLFNWLRTSELHPLVKSCVFHYEFEYIHPFADGNGRMGRLWHTLILAKWRPFFAWVPVESLIHDNQQAYYDALGNANNANRADDFVVFMLSLIKEALLAVRGTQESVRPNEDQKAVDIQDRILTLLSRQPSLSAVKLGESLGISARQAERHIKALREAGKLVRHGSANGGYWEVMQ